LSLKKTTHLWWGQNLCFLTPEEAEKKEGKMKRNEKKKIFLPRLSWETVLTLRKHHVKTNRKKESSKRFCRQKKINFL
jgi:hypothetical protein